MVVVEVPLNLELLPRALFSFGKNGCSFYILFLSVRNVILYRKKVMVVVMVGMVVNRTEREEGHAGKSEKKDQSKAVKVAAIQQQKTSFCL